MRTSHFSTSVGLPVYAVEFVAPHVVAYVGGGGASKSGVKNKLVLAGLEEDTLRPLAELTLSSDEDAPMCMAVDRVGGVIACSVNAPASALKSGENKTLRLFRYTLPPRWSGNAEDSAERNDKEGEASLVPVEAYTGLPITNPEQYPKVLALAPALTPDHGDRTPGPALLEAGTDGSVVVHPYPQVGSKPLWSATPTQPEALFGSHDEIYDADFAPSGAVVAIAAAQTLRVISAAGGEEPAVVQSILNPEVGGGKGTFRTVRFAPHGRLLYTVVNTTPARNAGKKAVRTSFVSAWEVDTWSLRDTRKVSAKPVTVFAVAPQGGAVATGGADLSVSVLDGETLRLRTKILAAHSFPSTTLAFSPDGQWLVSGSADNTIRCVRVPAASSRDPGSVLAAFLTALLLLLVAIAVQLQRQQQDK